MFLSLYFYISINQFYTEKNIAIIIGIIDIIDIIDIIVIIMIFTSNNYMLMSTNIYLYKWDILYI